MISRKFHANTLLKRSVKAAAVHSYLEASLGGKQWNELSPD